MINEDSYTCTPTPENPDFFDVLVGEGKEEKILKDRLNNIKGYLEILGYYSKIYKGNVFATKESREVFQRMSELLYRDRNADLVQFIRDYRELVLSIPGNYCDYYEDSEDHDLKTLGLEDEEGLDEVGGFEGVKRRTIQSRISNMRRELGRVGTHDGNKNNERPYAFSSDVQRMMDQISYFRD
jgi:hypothetical protein